ncbi:PBP1A family penicillin-binding protein [Vagococcus acidifermentans]|uniref:Penicillin-binding protein n=1 Tax=Vagococcus acidifermentans TaxID=564710 RepID=A0A430AUU3_9ENTE|nr:PBP1A family penicillin-binding protein [Vagococcus acidifermentans]RSU11821.1 penicillin-binding protein [Vagococcus acidifermentans]
MDFKQILAKLSASFQKIWSWLKPYWNRFRKWRRHVWKKYHVNKIILLTALVAILGFSMYLFYVAKSTNVSTLKSGLEQVTTVYDKDGDEAGTLSKYGQKGTFVTIDQVSQHIKDAVISTEDKRFYEHKGFDVRGIARAAVRMVINRNTSGGGGSTITQQLAKNAYLTLDQTFDRKARELFLAIEIEKQYSKDEILEMYLNNAYFANGVWGVEDASHKYFGKSAADVTIDEAAVIAGMLKGPGIYNPIDHLDNAKDRRDTVLDLMVTNGKLDEATAGQLKSEELYVRDDFYHVDDSYTFPYYFDDVINEAEHKAGIKDEDLVSKGYKIYTTLDQNYQKAMNTSFENDSLFPPNAEDGEKVQGASIAINPTTGGVMAVVGGRGDYTPRGLNRATNSTVSLSPGSTLKPLAVYTPALEAGYEPNDMLKDEPLSFYDVQNYTRTYSGQAPMYQALAQSLNAPAVWLLNEIGLDRGYKKVEKFGISLNEKDRYYGLALGGLTKGTNPLKMASAYSVFANQGERIEPYYITKIVDASGTVVYENKPKSVRVTTPEVAEEMTSMMQGVFSSGTGVDAQPYGYTMAGKTGTTESVNVDDASKDQWIIGYTPDVVIATWVGFDESSETHYLTGGSGSNLATLFRDESQRILAASPGTPFSVADASQENQTTESEEDFRQKLGEFGNNVKENAGKLGGKLKEGAEVLKDSLSDLLGGLRERIGQ